MCAGIHERNDHALRAVERREMHGRTLPTISRIHCYGRRGQQQIHHVEAPAEHLCVCVCVCVCVRACVRACSFSLTHTHDTRKDEGRIGLQRAGS